MPASGRRAQIRARIAAHRAVQPVDKGIVPIPPANDPERDRKADAIWAFLNDLYQATKDLEVHVNRERVLEYLDALRSKRFMAHVENSDLPYELKVDVSQLISGLSKAWPGVRDRVNSDSVERFAAMIYAMSELLDQVVEGLGIQVVIPTTIAGEDAPPDGARTQPDG